jgi:hypothetical protein
MICCTLEGILSNISFPKVEADVRIQVEVHGVAETLAIDDAPSQESDTRLNHTVT